MATLDISVVGLLLPVLARDLGAPLPLLSWVVLAYVLALTGFLLVFGRLADRIGRRRVYAAGLALFVLASILCALTRSAGALIAARALQGFGAAMMSANAGAILVAAFPPEQRGRALGAFGAAVGAGLAFGPVLGGAIAGGLSWHWVFLVNVPLGLVALMLLHRTVPPDGPPATARGPGLAAALLWAAGGALVMTALAGADAGGRAAAIAVAGAAALAGFAALDRRAAEPLLPWRDLAGPLGGALLLTLAGQAISMASAFLLPLELEEVRGLDPARAGRWLAIPPVAALLAAPLAGRLADRAGARPLAIAGLLVASAGAFALGRAGGSIAVLAGGSALLGLGLGLFSAPNASAVMGAVPPERLGTASGLQGTARNLGIAAGTAAATATVTALYASSTGLPLLGAPATAGHGAALARAIGVAFTGVAGLALVAAAASALLLPGRRRAT